MRMMSPIILNDLSSLARFIASPSCRSIVVLSGAGISVASGIPDFRSPGGMYDTLKPELLTATPEQRRLMEDDPTYVVSWDIFRTNPFPYLEVRRPFILGTQQQLWKATLSHRFVELLHHKTNKLTRWYTQNIDGLEYQCTDIPESKIVAVHGSIATVQCEGCGTPVDSKEFCQQVKTSIKDIYQSNDSNSQKQHQSGSYDAPSPSDDASPLESSPILCKNCHQSLVKPSTVLFGRSLPEAFWDCIEQDMPKCDLLLVIGTSLVVSPANSLVNLVPPDCPRVVINVEPVGVHMGMKFDKGSRDYLTQGPCDEIFIALAKELGWFNDLRGKMGLLPPNSRDLLRNMDGDSPENHKATTK